MPTEVQNEHFGGLASGWNDGTTIDARSASLTRNRASVSRRQARRVVRAAAPIRSDRADPPARHGATVSSLDIPVRITIRVNPLGVTLQNAAVTVDLVR
jgi:hypothetical protein